MSLMIHAIFTAAICAAFFWGVKIMSANSDRLSANVSTLSADVADLTASVNALIAKAGQPSDVDDTAVGAAADQIASLNDEITTLKGQVNTALNPTS